MSDEMIAGHSATLRRMLSRLEYRRLYGEWPPGASWLGTQVEWQIDTLVNDAVKDRLRRSHGNRRRQPVAVAAR